MLLLSPQSQIFVASQPIDFRKGIDGLIAVCRHILHQDPLKGALFLFYNKQRIALKILCFDGQGFLLMTKRLSSGRFSVTFPTPYTVACYSICYRSLQTLIYNGDPIAANFSKNWKPLHA